MQHEETNGIAMEEMILITVKDHGILLLQDEDPYEIQQYIHQCKKWYIQNTHQWNKPLKQHKSKITANVYQMNQWVYKRNHLTASVLVQHEGTNGIAMEGMIIDNI